MNDKIKIKLTPNIAKVFLNESKKNQEYIKVALVAYKNNIKNKNLLPPVVKWYVKEKAQAEKSLKRVEANISYIEKKIKQNKPFEIAMTAEEYLHFTNHMLNIATKKYNAAVKKLKQDFFKKHNMDSYLNDWKKQQLANSYFAKTYPQYKEADDGIYHNSPYIGWDESKDYEYKKESEPGYVEKHLTFKMLDMPEGFKKFLGKEFMDVFLNIELRKQAICITKYQDAVEWKQQRAERDKKYQKADAKEKLEINKMVKKHKLDPKEELEQPTFKIR